MGQYHANQRSARRVFRKKRLTTIDLNTHRRMKLQKNFFKNFLLILFALTKRPNNQKNLPAAQNMAKRLQA